MNPVCIRQANHEEADTPRPESVAGHTSILVPALDKGVCNRIQPDQLESDPALIRSTLQSKLSNQHQGQTAEYTR